MYMTTTLFQSTGRAVPASVVSLVQETVFFPILLVGTALMGVNGFAWAIPAGDVTAMLIGLVLQRA
jgi:Na+-driven multidrug efflux pump